MNAPLIVPTPRPVYDEPFIDGYCYLAVFSPSARRRAADTLGYRPGRETLVSHALKVPAQLDPGPFSISLTAPLGHIGEFSVIAHITRTSPCFSNLSALRVLSLLPMESVVGSEGSSDMPLITARDIYAAPQLRDPLVRRILVPPTSILFKESSVIVTFNPATASQLQSWTKLFPIVHMQSMRIVFVPSVGSTKAATQFVYCWWDTAVAAPTTTKEIREDQTCQIHAAGPTGAGTMHPQFSVDAPFHGFSRRLKPSDKVVGHPAFVCAVQSLPIGTDSFDDSLIYSIHAEYVLDARSQTA